ncbi:MAG: hypothetical protein HY081_01885 [Gammaproteobacteria bacterium]|nr:hypothetical protein [Gammaproteobacteria bacterium]
MNRIFQKYNLWPKLAMGVTTAAIVLIASEAGAYYEDLKEGDTGPHSTFHYEMTRTLARAAGFSKTDAEMIAVAAEATDRMLYTGTLPGSPTIQLAGTERMDSSKGPYFHWPRRGVYNATNQYEQPGARNTCLYFTRTDKCINAKPEINAIENWAVFNVGAPAVGTPSASVNGGASTPVQGSSSIALGIYLHALADTYTHDPCMKKLQVRSHMSRTSLTIECSVVRWHQDQEFGPEATNLGTSYTKEGGLAVWKALLFFRQSNSLPTAALWNETQAVRFIKTYSEMENEIDRSNYATSTYTSLN